MTSDIAAERALLLAREGTLLIDLREDDEWALGRSPLARNLPMSQLQERLAELPHGERIMFVCHSGGRSGRVTSALIAAGYDAVNVAGGMIAWSAAGGELVADGSQPPRVH